MRCGIFLFVVFMGCGDAVIYGDTGGADRADGALGPDTGADSIDAVPWDAGLPSGIDASIDSVIDAGVSVPDAHIAIDAGVDASPYPMVGPGEICDVMWQNCIGGPTVYGCVPATFETRTGTCQAVGPRTEGQTCGTSAPLRCAAGMYCTTNYECRNYCLYELGGGGCEAPYHCATGSVHNQLGWCEL